MSTVKLGEKTDADSSELDEVPVAEVFRRIWRSFEAVEKSKSPVLTAEECVSACKRLIPTLDWLSSDQDKSSMTHDDYSTGELELTLLPCLMAFFEDKLSVTEASQRRDRLTRIILLYRFYLTTFRQLHISDKDEEDEEGSASQAKSPEYLRNKAIANFKAQQALFAKIEDQSSLEHDSESKRRQRALDMLSYWSYRSRREIELAEKELKLLSMGPGSQQAGASASSSRPAAAGSMPVFDINMTSLRNVRDNLRRTVFGLGYPAAPTLTPEEWFDNKMIEDARHAHAHPPPPKPRQREEGEDTDSEEEETRRQDKMRMDAYKDDHRRGEGNTYRRG